MKARDREQWARELEQRAHLEPPYMAAYLKDCARQIRCPDRTSFQGVRLKNAVHPTNPSLQDD